jgi:hypothetical protein
MWWKVAGATMAWLAIAAQGRAQTLNQPISFSSAPLAAPRLHINWNPASARRAGPVIQAGMLFAPEAIAAALGDPLLPAAQEPPAQAPLHAAAIEHSEAYQTRARIHRIASFATLPLFATELALGQSIYNSPTNLNAKKSAHIVVGTGIIGLFGVNTVTGAWNLFGEGLHDEEGRTLRLVHGLLMMAADAGFVATSMTGPGGQSRQSSTTFASDKMLHRNLAVFSISAGTAGYLLMLFGNR